jgi:Zn-dependent protease with chaperone function
VIWGLVLPTVVAVGAAFGAARLHRLLRPDWAAWTLTVLVGGAAVAVVAALGVLALGYALQQPPLGGLFGWCQALFSSHDRVPTTAGVLSWLVLIAMAVSVVLRARMRRAAVSSTDQELVWSTEPVAFASPAAGGRVVVSVGMLAALDPAERRVLYAHERSHLRHRHHRFLHVAEIASAAVPLLRPLSAQVRFATERWADEDAAREVGDRELVARAIARAALATTAPPPTMAFTGHTTVARVQAMLHPGRRRVGSTATLAVMGVAAIATSLGGSTLQLHHVLEFIGHVCHLT